MYTICEVSKVYCNNKTIVLFSKSECFLFPLEQLCAYENPVTILMMIQKYTNKKLSETENRIRSIEAGSFRGGRVGRISVAGGECPSVLNRNSRGTKKMGKHWAQPAASPWHSRGNVQFGVPEAVLIAGVIRKRIISSNQILYI